jgi:septin 7
VDGQSTTPGDYVGFANLPDQVHRRAIKRGFEFNLMVVGQSGLGKSTLLNCLFLTELYGSDYPGPSNRIKKTLTVETTSVILKESGVTLRLTLIDTPGYGDLVDNTNCWQPIVDYIEARFNDYLTNERRINRPVQIPDTRVHCCLFFISPTGHG